MENYKINISITCNKCYRGLNFIDKCDQFDKDLEFLVEPCKECNNELIEKTKTSFIKTLNETFKNLLKKKEVIEL